MAYRLTMQERFDCPRSYATDDNKNLLCSIGDEICDGQVYECCLWDASEDLVYRIMTAEERENNEM